MMGDTVLGGLLRVPAAGEFRGNLAVGGSAVATELDARDHEIVAAVLPSLREAGLWFVGLDVIGGLLTEVNVTSPTGIQEIMKFSDPTAAARTLDVALTLGSPTPA
jgi:glutathione synthase